MGKINGRFVIILNIAKVLSIDEIALLGQLAGEDAPPPAPGAAAPQLASP